MPMLTAASNSQNIFWRHSWPKQRQVQIQEARISHQIYHVYFSHKRREGKATWNTTSSLSPIPLNSPLLSLPAAQYKSPKAERWAHPRASQQGLQKIKAITEGSSCLRMALVGLQGWEEYEVYLVLALQNCQVLSNPSRKHRQPLILQKHSLFLTPIQRTRNSIF